MSLSRFKRPRLLDKVEGLVQKVAKKASKPKAVKSKEK